MKRRSLIPVAAMLAIGSLLTACSAQSGAGSAPSGDADTLTIALGTAPDTWNPQEALASDSFAVFPQIYSGLLGTSADGTEIRNDLATEYEFDTVQNTITFSIDPKAAFSDGTPVTAEDVIFSESLWAAGELYGSYFSSISEVTAADEHTVVFQLTSPDSALLGILATTNAAIVPKDFGGVDAEAFWKKPIGAGPYAIASEKTGEKIELVKNEHFTDAPDRPENVKYVVVSDNAQRMLQFESGQVDIVNNVQLASASQFPEGSLQSTSSAGTSTLIMNNAAAPFDDVNLRKAMSLVMDHEALLEGGYSGLAVQATSVLPQIIPGVQACDGCDWGKYDLDAAKALIEKSNYDGSPISLIVSSEGGPQAMAAQALTPMFAEAGITVNVEAIATSALIERLSGGDFDMAALTYGAAAPSPLDPLGFLASTSIIFSGADTTAATTAVTALQSAPDEESIKAATAAFEQWAFDNAPVVPLAVSDIIYAVSDKVSGFVPNHFGSYSVAELSIS